MSVTSEAPLERENNEQEVNLDETLEELREKRATSREKALKTFIKNFQYEYQDEFAEQHETDLVEAIQRGLKKGAEEEQKLACDFAKVLAITLGPSDKLFPELKPALEFLIQNSEVPDSVRASSIDALSLICFISNQEESITRSLLELIGANIKNPSADIQIAALQGWMLLVGVVDRSYFYDNLFPDNFSEIVELLRSESVDVRLTAGYAVALCVELLKEVEGEEFTLESIHGYVDKNDLVELISLLSEDKSKQRAKKEKLKQRQPFKLILNYLENETFETETLSFRHQKVDFDSWWKLIVLDCFRTCLEGGLNNHFENNDLLQEIFDVSIDPTAKKHHFSAVEKRMYFSPSSLVNKSRTKDMKRLRNNKSQN